MLYAVCSMHDLRDEISRVRLVCDYVCHFASEHAQSVMQGYPTSKEAIFLAVHSQPRLRSFLDKFFENSESETLQEARVPDGASVGARSFPLFRWNTLKKTRECSL